MEINGHAAVVTGGASGLGAATADELARAGAKVACLDKICKPPARSLTSLAASPCNAT